MPARPYGRSRKADSTNVETIEGGLARLLSRGAYDRNQLDRLRELIDKAGGAVAAHRVRASVAPRDSRSKFVNGGR